MAKKKAKKPQSRSFILTLGIVLLVGYFIITFIGLQISVNDSRGELEKKQTELQQAEAERDRLETVVNNEDKSDYIEQVAREKLGYVLPGEKVFYDVTPGA